MIIASRTLLAQITGTQAYRFGNFHEADAAAVNVAVVSATGGKVPCYAIAGKRVAFKWVSVGSSAVIGRGEAARMLRNFGANIDAVEMVGIPAVAA